MMARPPEPTVAETYDQPGGLVAQYLAERIENIKREHQTLKKMEAAKQLTARELTRRVESIQSGIRWLKEECLSYAENRGTKDDLVAALETVRLATKAIRKKGRGRDARDYWITKTTATLQGWLERNHLLLSIADIEPNFLEEEWEALKREAAIQEAKQHPFERYRRPLDAKLEQFDREMEEFDEPDKLEGLDVETLRSALKGATFIPVDEESAKAMETGKVDPEKIVQSMTSIEPVPADAAVTVEDKDADKDEEGDAHGDADSEADDSA